jgi:hypothetical protein
MGDTLERRHALQAPPRALRAASRLRAAVR